VGIVDEDIARVRAATDFVALASEHLALRRVGTRWVGLCPFHAESNPSFSLNAELGLYHCFGCQASGDAITFVRELEHVDFVEAVEKLAGRAGITLRYDDESPGRDHTRFSRIYETVAAAVDWYHARLLDAPDAAGARRYLRAERGYDGEVVRRYQLGWAPDGWEPLLRALKLPRSALVDAGLGALDDAGRYRDFFRSRLIFPIFDPADRPIGAGGRMLPGGRPPKYKNTTGTAVYDKSSVLYGLNWAKREVVARDRVVVCEGYTDVIGLQRAGVGEAVATCGTALADGHVRLLTKFARRIVLAYDADAAGQAAAERVHEWERRFEVDIRVAALPAGEDPADLARRDPAGLQRAVAGAEPFVAFQLSRHFGRADLGSVEGRVRAAGVAVDLVAGHPDPLVRDQYLMQIADRCRVAPDDLRRMASDPSRARRVTAADRQGRGGRRPVPRGATGGNGRAGFAAGSDGQGDTWEREAANRPDDEPVDDRFRSNSGKPRVGESGTGRAGSGARGPRALPAPERAVLVLAVRQTEEVVDRLERVLLSHPLAVAVFDALSSADTLGEAIGSAPAPVAGLLAELAVSEPEGSVDDVMTRVVELAGRRAVAELQAEIKTADPADVPAYVANLEWLILALEQLRPAGGGDIDATRNA
jgi:DNA primase